VDSVVLSGTAQRGERMLDAPSLDDDEHEEAYHADYGGLDVRFFAEEGMRRVIYKDTIANGKDDDVSKNYNDVDYYYMFDDDEKRNPYVAWHDKHLHETKKCRRTAWHRRLPIDCNSMHEFDFLRYESM
jgi:hypothetical protein